MFCFKLFIDLLFNVYLIFISLLLLGGGFVFHIIYLDDLKRIVGSENCRRGSSRIFEMLQHTNLNKRFFYALFESFLQVLFADHNIAELINKLQAGKKKKVVLK